MLLRAREEGMRAAQRAGTHREPLFEVPAHCIPDCHVRRERAIGAVLQESFYRPACRRGAVREQCDVVEQGVQAARVIIRQRLVQDEDKRRIRIGEPDVFPEEYRAVHERPAGDGGIKIVNAQLSFAARRAQIVNEACAPSPKRFVDNAIVPLRGEAQDGERIVREGRGHGLYESVSLSIACVSIAFRRVGEVPLHLASRVAACTTKSLRFNGARVCLRSYGLHERRQQVLHVACVGGTTSTQFTTDSSSKNLSSQ